MLFLLLFVGFYSGVGAVWYYRAWHDALNV